MERMREKKIQGKSEETETNDKMGEGDNILRGLLNKKSWLLLELKGFDEELYNLYAI